MACSGTALPFMSVLKLPLLVDLLLKADELVVSITACPSFLKTRYISLQKKCGYGNFNHRYNVFPVHLHVLLSMGKFTKVVRVCAEHL
jgi:hypothetical protein